MKVAIMQPTYLPWSGYFGLISHVDLFIVLDTVQFAKRSWQQRNYIKTKQGAQLLTVPVFSKGKRDQLIKDTLIDTSRRFQQSHLKAIELAYTPTPFYDEFLEVLLPLLSSDINYLSDLNYSIIKGISTVLGLQTPFVLASTLSGSGKKADLLCSLATAVNATSYITVPGSLSYLLESSVFSDAGIDVQVFDYTHPIYPQLGADFIQSMSMIDLCFNDLRGAKNIVYNSSSIVSISSYLSRFS